jgi:hypothetical protein
MLLAAVRRGDPAVNGSSNGSGPAAEEPVEPAEQEDATS